LVAPLVDVWEELAALVAHAATHDRRAGGDVLGLEDAGNAGGGDHDLRPSRVLGPVGPPGGHGGDGGAGRPAPVVEERGEGTGRRSVVRRPRMHTSCPATGTS